ncbi:hypothetical protein BOTBODRAFT_133086 [Botryobasidium botryosum FD-172 SS1]|uniref:FAD-binding domain-containing protein n=1 Tax=Botryobasidium botryosum (strain FD-172 SS1) TaxID=930990 RepID=A0A067MQJ2_BOTB1|nr:hypothetical protein BOTBODRAFT_133086 [Botryobasidium botryosum FD-172 SS1]
MTSPQPAVLVVGAGPAGLAAALSLAKNSVPVRIIEKNDAYQVGARGVGIQPRTLEVFANLGVLDDVLAKGITQPIMRAYAPNGRDIAREWNFLDVVELSPSVPYPNPTMIAQDDTEAILRDHLQRYNVQVELGHELVGLEQDDKGVTAQIFSHTPNANDTNGTTETLRVSWLIGADGARGITRKTLGLDFIGETRESEGALLADLEVENLDRDAWQFWGSTGVGGVALRPLPGGSRAVLMGRIESADMVWDADLSRIQEHFNAISKRDDIKFTKVNWVSKWRPNIRMVNKFYVGRVFVIGDAAHIHSPTGGQGLNSSVQDAYNLSWKVALAYKKLASASLLSTYETERMPVIAEMLNISTKLLNRYSFNIGSPGATANPNAAADPWMRDAKLRQLGVNCRWSPIVVDERTPAVEGEVKDVYGVETGVVCAGDRAPDASSLVDIANDAITLFGEFSPTTHTALVFAQQDGSVAPPILQKLESYNSHASPNSPLVQSIVILPSTTSPQSHGDYTSAKTLVDREGHARSAYAIKDDEPASVIIVRPDGVVGAIVEGVDGIGKYFSGVFGTSV